MGTCFASTDGRATSVGSLASTLAVGCHRDERFDGDTSPTLPAQPVRGAVGDADLRVMATELVAVGACDRIRGHFQGLRASNRPDVVSGVLWLRECRVASSGTKVVFQLAGNGWEWVEEKSGRAGGTFAVKQYVRFGMSIEMSGEIDIGYDRESHVASVWFSPDSLPEVTKKRATRFSWRRPALESAWSTGGPLIDCGAQ